jgi:DNA-binding protein H-NS
MTNTDLDKLSVEELKKLQKGVAKAVASFEDRKRAAVIAELEAVAQKHGYKLADLTGGKKAKVTSPVKYIRKIHRSPGAGLVDSHIGLRMGSQRENR